MLHVTDAAFASSSTNDRRMNDIFRQRATQLAARGVRGPSLCDTTPFLVVRVGEETYGVELRFVAQVFPATRMTRVPRASEAIWGIANLEGEIRPVIGLGRLLGVPESEVPTNQSIVLLRRDHRRIGLLVEHIDGIRPVDLRNLIVPEAEPNDRPSGYLAGMTRDQVLLLRTDRLFERD